MQYWLIELYSYQFISNYQTIATAAYKIPASLANTTSGTFVMLTKVAPKLRYILLSALLENRGPSTKNT